jgi:hypothetical protein
MIDDRTTVTIVDIPSRVGEWTKRQPRESTIGGDSGVFDGNIVSIDVVKQLCWHSWPNVQ